MAARKTSSLKDLTEFKYYRQRYLPGQIKAAREKLKALENEARRYGMTELLEASE